MSQWLYPNGITEEFAVLGPGGYASDLFETAPNVYDFPNTQDSYLPIDVQLLSLVACQLNTQGINDGQTIQTRVNALRVGPTLSPPAGGRMSGNFDDVSPVIVPALSMTSLDGAGRIGFNIASGGFNALGILLEYEPVNSADTGKQIMGIGAAGFVDANSASSPGDGGASLFAPLVSPFSTISFFGAVATLSAWFVTAFETIADYTAYVKAGHPGERRPPATWPWLTPGTLQDFYLWFRSPPTSSYSFAFRKNKQTVFTIDAVAGSQRIFGPTGGPKTVNVTFNDLVCWQNTVAGPLVDAGLIWTFRKGNLHLSGYGELGYGEGGYGTM